jgi:hypothetical protein
MVRQILRHLQTEEGDHTMKLQRECVAALLGTVVLTALALPGCEKRQSAVSKPTGAATVRVPAECSTAKSAAECGEILKQEGKDPAAQMPPCKSGAAQCEVWERMWPQ